jgi:hypothetical protein
MDEQAEPPVAELLDSVRGRRVGHLRSP